MYSIYATDSVSCRLSVSYLHRKSLHRDAKTGPRHQRLTRQMWTSECIHLTVHSNATWRAVPRMNLRCHSDEMGLNSLLRVRCLWQTRRAFSVSCWTRDDISSEARLSLPTHQVVKPSSTPVLYPKQAINSLKTLLILGVQLSFYTHKRELPLKFLLYILVCPENNKLGLSFCMLLTRCWVDAGA